MLLNEQQRKQVADKLIAAGATKPCARCGNVGAEVLDGYFALSAANEIGAVVLGGQQVPCAAVACARCGAVTLHALGVIGLLPQGK